MGYPLSCNTVITWKSRKPWSMMRCSSSSVAALLGAHTRMRGLRAKLGNVRLKLASALACNPWPRLSLHASRIVGDHDRLLMCTCLCLPAAQCQYAWQGITHDQWPCNLGTRCWVCNPKGSAGQSLKRVNSCLHASTHCYWSCRARSGKATRHN